MAERTARWVRRHPGRAAVLAAGAVFVVALTAAVWVGLAALAATARAVDRDVSEAEQALGRADWAEARAALRRATARLGDRGHAALRQRADLAARALDLGTRLEGIRLGRATHLGRRPALRQDRHPRVHGEYQTAFGEAGLASVGDPPQQVADRVTGSLVRSVLAAALDDWVTYIPDDRLGWLLEVSGRDDPGPDTGWRDRAVWTDLAALTALAEAVPRDDRSVPLQLALAGRLRRAGGDPLPLLRRVQADHPADLWATAAVIAEPLRRGDPEAIPFARVPWPCGRTSPCSTWSWPRRWHGRGGSPRRWAAPTASANWPPTDVAALVLAIGSDQLGRPEAAVEHFRRVLRLDPDSSAHILLGHALLELGRLAEARTELARGVEASPPDSLFRRTADEQMRWCDRLAALEPRLAAVVGGGYRPVGPVAARDLARAAEARPGPQAVNALWLALCHHRLGRPDEARRWLAQATTTLDRLRGKANTPDLHLHDWLEAQAYGGRPRPC